MGVVETLMAVAHSRAVGSFPGVGQLIDQNDDAAEGSEIEVRSVQIFPPSFSDIRMGSRGTFVL